MDTKICGRCKKEKSISEFNKNTKAKDGLGRWCRECLKEYNRERYLNDLENNREKNKIKNKKYRQQYPQRYKDTCKRWRNNHPLRYLLLLCIRRAKEINLPYDDLSILEQYIKPIYEQGKCECCGKELILDIKNNHEECFSIDKIIPQNGYKANNIAILCLECNRKKSNMTWQEMLFIGNWLKNKTESII